MILFLDFDGVLHPEGEDHVLNGGADFCFLPRVEALLREFPQVKIVISSSWREQLLYKTLLSPFSSDIRARILGATPHSGFGLPPPYRKREGEILAWLQLHDAVEEPWVALDDAHWQFDSCRDHLVVCDSFVGFDDKASAELRARFEGASLRKYWFSPTFTSSSRRSSRCPILNSMSSSSPATSIRRPSAPSSGRWIASEESP